MRRTLLFAPWLLVGVQRSVLAAGTDDVASPPRPVVAEAAPPLGTVSVHAVADAVAHGDLDLALVRAEALMVEGTPRAAAAAALVVGRLHRSRGHHAPARAAFAAGLALGGPLAPWLAWHEADTLLEVGEDGAALDACRRYLTRWSEGPHRESCQELIALALARTGQVREAELAAAAWDGTHSSEAIGESVGLAIAASLVATDPTQAARRYRALATTFHMPGTAEAADRGLAALAAQGVEAALTPWTLSERQARAISLRDARVGDTAWLAFEALAAEPDASEAALNWVASELPGFASATRRQDVLARWWGERWAEAPDEPDLAYQVFRALERGGRYSEAFQLGRRMASPPPRTGPWSDALERVARDGLLARQYAASLPLLDELGKARGADGERNRFYAAFAAVQAGDREGALRRIEAGLASDSLASGYRYWRAKLLDISDPAAAADDRAWILRHDPTSWYALLLRAPPPSAPRVRTGRLPAPEAPGVLPGVAPQLDLNGFAPFGSLPTSAFHDPVSARAAFDDLRQRYGSAFPALDAVADLVDIGLIELAGPLFESVVDDWRARLRRRDKTARDWASRFDRDRMRLLYQHTHDHADLTRVAWGLAESAAPAERRAVLALALPLAQSQAVWRAGRSHDVDPMLVLGLMRTESMYDVDAVSPVGARGPMQIMPRTGHLLAQLSGDTSFHSGKLHNPDLAIDYGVRYLDLLIARFDGAWPLAVAAYNGGPHNVSLWRSALGPDTPLDVFVEHIPWKETRRYVRTVSERYADYLSVYAPDHALYLPSDLGGDDPTLVDF